jgi:hypothetical protein
MYFLVGRNIFQLDPNIPTHKLYKRIDLRNYLSRGRYNFRREACPPDSVGRSVLR